MADRQLSLFSVKLRGSEGKGVIVVLLGHLRRRSVGPPVMASVLALDEARELASRMNPVKLTLSSHPGPFGRGDVCS